MDFSILSIFNGISSAFLLFLYLLLGLNIFSLPANWIILGVIAIWNFFWPFSAPLSFWQWGTLIILALLGEAVETLFQFYKAKKYGSSTGGSFASLLGAILGAILLAPVFWGLGAILGAMLGAWAGCYFMERLIGTKPSDAAKAAYGSMLGRFLGMASKIGIGVLIILLAGQWLSPANAALPEYIPPQQDETFSV